MGWSRVVQLPLQGLIIAVRRSHGRIAVCWSLSFLPTSRLGSCQTGRDIQAMNMPHMMVHPLFAFLNSFSAVASIFSHEFLLFKLAVHWSSCSLSSGNHSATPSQRVRATFPAGSRGHVACLKPSDKKFCWCLKPPHAQQLGLAD